MQKAKIFTNARGVEFYVRIIKEGERYGADVHYERNGVDLTAFDSAARWKSEELGVIFYDFEYAFQSQHVGPMGQQISTYYLETILRGNGGIDLMGYEAKWKIDDVTMFGIRQWLAAYVEENGNG